MKQRKRKRELKIKRVVSHPSKIKKRGNLNSILVSIPKRTANMKV